MPELIDPVDRNTEFPADRFIVERQPVCPKLDKLAGSHLQESRNFVRSRNISVEEQVNEIVAVAVACIEQICLELVSGKLSKRAPHSSERLAQLEQQVDAELWISNRPVHTQAIEGWKRPLLDAGDFCDDVDQV